MFVFSGQETSCMGAMHSQSRQCTFLRFQRLTFRVASYPLLVQHVHWASYRNPEELLAYKSGLLMQNLNPNFPLWEIHVVTNEIAG